MPRGRDQRGGVARDGPRGEGTVRGHCPRGPIAGMRRPASRRRCGARSRSPCRATIVLPVLTTLGTDPFRFGDRVRPVDADRLPDAALRSGRARLRGSRSARGNARRSSRRRGTSGSAHRRSHAAFGAGSALPAASPDPSRRAQAVRPRRPPTGLGRLADRRPADGPGARGPSTRPAAAPPQRCPPRSGTSAPVASARATDPTRRLRSPQTRPLRPPIRPDALSRGSPDGGTAPSAAPCPRPVAGIARRRGFAHSGRAERGPARVQFGAAPSNPLDRRAGYRKPWRGRVARERSPRGGR